MTQTAQTVRSILLIEDDEPLGRSLGKLLSLEGYSVHIARNGAEGVRLARTQPIDMVITDIYMDGMDGLQTIPLLKKAAPNIPIIAMSGGSNKTGIDCLNMARFLGAGKILFKPFSANDLLRSIETTLGSTPKLQREACN